MKYERLYSRLFIAGLTEELGLDPDVADTLRRGLEDAANYRMLWAEQMPPPSDAEARKFGNVWQKVKAAKIALASLSSEDFELLGQMQNCWVDPDQFPRLARARCHHDLEELLPATILPEYGSDPNDQDPFSFEELQEMLGDTLSILNLGTIREKFPRGPRPDKQLENWMADARDIWIEITGRTFTRDFTGDDEPVSEAARFCVKTYAVISPETPRSRINWAMKRLIAARNS